MSMQTVKARIRGFICVNAHPGGCAANVDREIAIATREAPGKGMRDALVIGASTGYGLSSLVTTVFGYGARGLGVCLERPPVRDKTASAGWYNLGAVVRAAAARGREVSVINGDAFSDEVKAQTIARLKAGGAKLDAIVYSVAAPKRTDAATGQTWMSALKTIGAPYRNKSIDLVTDTLTEVEIAPATESEIESTRRVMGGEDFAAWTRALLEADLLAEGCRAVAYSYIGPVLTYPIYREGTIGKAKEDLESTTKALSATLHERLGGAAYVSINKALVTQASAAIPVVPLYISALYKVMKAAGTHEGTAEQIARLYRDHLGPGKRPTTDEAGRIRIDDREMDVATQLAVKKVWDAVTADNVLATTDYAGFQRDFRRLFGFEVEGIDYAAPVETDVPIETKA
jgi:enoyl-[acyl-carrier protein] reductase/trans-2-enoyl-CoA reductase (NAD+)